MAVRLTPRVASGDRAVVAVSGGLDSVVLLHVLRFSPEVPPLDLVVGHFDHRMRPGSDADAAWVRDLAEAWGLPFAAGVAEAPLASEAAARHARYAFLDELRARGGARWILTAHHADDQAETVLFRVARGTGWAGLRGIPARRGPILRPLLGAWREGLEEYARVHGLEHRIDPTNADPAFARNVLRHRILPDLAAVAPGARRSLVRLAHAAAREERAWRALLPDLLRRAVVDRTERRVALDRNVALAWPDGLLARILRACARDLGHAPDGAGTRVMVQFTRSGASGRSIRLPGGLGFAREFDRLVVFCDGEAEPVERSLDISDAREGEATTEVGGRALRVRWWTAARERGEAPCTADAGAVALDRARLAFPLRLRRWSPGDRIRLPYGTKKLKKLLGEARVPVGERARVCVLTDATGRVLWVPGLAVAVGCAPGPGVPSLCVEVRDDGAA